MPELSDRTADPFVKIMLIGHSGAGKTGALTSLAKDGYRIRILDFDNGLDALVNHVKAECPDKLKNISFMSFRDKTKIGSAGPMIVGTPKAFTQGTNALEKWEDGTDPAEWGSDTILVIDSLTNMGKAAYAFVRQMNLALKDDRLIYRKAQEVIEDIVANVTNETFRTNVIIMSHIDLVTMPDNTTQGFPSAVGKALGPKLPRYFNTLVLLESSGTGKSVKRRLKTYPTATVMLKNPAPMTIEAEYPIETGLKTLFDKLKGKA